jgi:hypothetical protein
MNRRRFLAALGMSPIVAREARRPRVSGGGWLFLDGGELKWRGSTGTVTTLTCMSVPLSMAAIGRLDVRELLWRPRIARSALPADDSDDQMAGHPARLV